MLNFYFEGASFFLSLTQAISEAKQRVDLEIYYIANDEIGNKVAELLKTKAKEGVKVRLIADSVGCLTTPSSFFDELREAGVYVKIFNPLLSMNRLATRRDHRKIAVIDADCCFLGGLNLAKEYCHGDGDSPPWRDTGVKITDRELTEQMEWCFEDSWLERGFSLKGWLKRVQDPDWTKCSHCLIPYHGRYKTNPIRREYIRAIVRAKKYVHVCNPYFIPDRGLRRALEGAARRGVEVRILTSEESDVPIVRWASHATYGPLLMEGVKIFEYQKRVMHAKSAVIDDEWFTIGTSNLDHISLSYNLEINLFGMNPPDAQVLNDQFRLDLEGSKEITLEQWKKRPVWRKMREGFFYLFKNWL